MAVSFWYREILSILTTKNQFSSQRPWFPPYGHSQQKEGGVCLIGPKPKTNSSIPYHRYNGEKWEKKTERAQHTMSFRRKESSANKTTTTTTTTATTTTATTATDTTSLIQEDPNMQQPRSTVIEEKPKKRKHDAFTPHLENLTRESPENVPSAVQLKLSCALPEMGKQFKLRVFFGNLEGKVSHPVQGSFLCCVTPLHKAGTVSVTLGLDVNGAAKIIWLHELQCEHEFIAEYNDEGWAVSRPRAKPTSDDEMSWSDLLSFCSGSKSKDVADRNPSEGNYQTLKSLAFLLAAFGITSTLSDLLNDFPQFLDATQEPSLNNLLWFAVHSGNVSTVELLLDQGVDINHVNQAGRTVLQLATERGDPDMICLLSKRGVNHSVRDNTGNHAHDCPRQGDSSEFRGLLEASTVASPVTPIKQEGIRGSRKSPTAKRGDDSSPVKLDKSANFANTLEPLLRRIEELNSGTEMKQVDRSNSHMRAEEYSTIDFSTHVLPEMSQACLAPEVNKIKQFSASSLPELENLTEFLKTQGPIWNKFTKTSLPSVFPVDRPLQNFKTFASGLQEDFLEFAVRDPQTQKKDLTERGQELLKYFLYETDLLNVTNALLTFDMVQGSWANLIHRVRSMIGWKTPKYSGHIYFTAKLSPATAVLIMSKKEFYFPGFIKASMNPAKLFMKEEDTNVLMEIDTTNFHHFLTCIDSETCLLSCYNAYQFTNYRLVQHPYKPGKTIPTIGMNIRSSENGPQLGCTEQLKWQNVAVKFREKPSPAKFNALVEELVSSNHLNRNADFKTQFLFPTERGFVKDGRDYKSLPVDGVDDTMC